VVNKDEYYSVQKFSSYHVMMKWSDTLLFLHCQCVN